jgi:DsbC/DsbD-like thiol-disulfide interchange protein
MAPKAARILAVLLLAQAANAARADDASPWAKGHYAQTRLLSGEIAGVTGETQIVAGVQIKLDPGWKTYWRNPGDSGLPPSFDWSQSQNLKSAKVLWPAPHRFSDSYGTSIGYTGGVVFPVEIVAERKGEPVDVKLKLDYAICKDICVPAEAKLDLRLGDGARRSAGFAGEISRFMTLVPRKSAKEGAGAPNIERAEAKLTGSAPSIVVEARFPEGTKGADLFAEGGSDIYLPPPQTIKKTGEASVRFTIALGKDAEAAKLKGREIKLTLVSDAGSSETLWKVE